MPWEVSKAVLHRIAEYLNGSSSELISFYITTHFNKSDSFKPFIIVDDYYEILLSLFFVLANILLCCFRAKGTWQNPHDIKVFKQNWQWKNQEGANFGWEFICPNRLLFVQIRACYFNVVTAPYKYGGNCLEAAIKEVFLHKVSFMNYDSRHVLLNDQIMTLK